jgi:uncharacterized protein (TIGR02996 family)
MTDRDALLHAICENPDDDAPRLIYADWLDEHGDSMQATFIRLQIETNNGGKPDQVRLQETEIWRQLRKWRFLPLNWLELSVTDFKRGFAIRWRGGAKDFLNLAPTWWRLGPIESIAIQFDSGIPYTLKDSTQIANCEALRGLVDLSPDGRRFDDRWLAAFLASPFSTTWHQLNIAGDDLTVDACDILTESALANTSCKIRLTLITSDELASRVQLLRDSFGDRLRLNALTID